MDCNYVIDEFIIIIYKINIFTYKELKIKVSSEKLYHCFNLEEDILEYKNKIYNWWTKYILSNYPKMVYYNKFLNDIYKNKYSKYIYKNNINLKNIIDIYVIKEFNWK